MSKALNNEAPYRKGWLNMRSGDGGVSRAERAGTISSCVVVDADRDKPAPEKSLSLRFARGLVETDTSPTLGFTRTAWRRAKTPSEGYAEQPAVN